MSAIEDIAVAEHKVQQTVAVLDALLATIGDENDRLASGLPASLAQSVGQKMQLSTELDLWLEAMRRGELGARNAAPPSMPILVERLQLLKPLMADNVRLIRASMHASRRRIDAIMQALRGAGPRTSGYGTDSRISRRPASAGGSQWA